MNCKGFFFFLLSTCLFFNVILVNSSPAHADCSFESTADGYHIVCSGTILGGISGTDQRDVIRILPQATVLYDWTDSGDNSSEAMIIGIDGLQGHDEITNEGDIEELRASAQTTAVGVSLTIDGTVKGDSSGAALSDSSATADASATGIDGGTDNDTIDNRAKISADVEAVVAATDVATDITVTLDGNASGAALSDSSVTANATAIGIEGGEGNDMIENAADIETLATSDADAVAVDLTIDGTVKGDSSGAALSDSSATVDAMATGIDGGMGMDEITNRGKILADVDSTVTAVGVGVGVEITKEGNASGAALSDASVTANAAADGIDGGEDADNIDNRGDIELMSSSDATGVAVSLDVAGTMKGDAEGKAVSDASATATSTATGIDGGEGDDTINNEGMITLMNGSGDDETDASATAVSVGLTVSGTMEGNVAGEALSDGSATADAMATGIDGGSGMDEITNRGAIVGNVDSSATTVGVAVDIGITEEGNVLGAALSDASVEADATASGIDGGEDADNIDNRGDIELMSSSDATGVAVSLDVAGTMKGDAEGKAVSDASATATSMATGIDGGEGNDNIDNEGTITLMNGSGDDETDASATAVSVGLTVSGSMEGNVAGEALIDSSATADAMATGIDGGMGIDKITNRGAIVGNVDSGSTAVGVAVDIGITEEGNVLGAALSDASVSANATVGGIDGGNDNDSIDNRGNIGLSADSNATGVAVSLDVAGTMKGDAEGKAVSDASITATSTATGIDGGEGDDTIINDSLMTTAHVHANATAVSVGLTVSGSMEGNVEGEALSDGSATADAMATGISGGGGQDTIDNWAGIFEDVDAGATTVGVGLDIAITKEGNASGGALSDASVTANAAAGGIDGGGDADDIDNRGDIELLANSDVTGVAVSLDVAGTMKGDAEGKAVSDASVTATSTATGIDGGEGDDTIINDSLMTTAHVHANATAVSVGLTVSGSMEGNVAGEALSDSSATADAMATGIDGGSGIDEITNRGAIVGNVDSSSTAVGVGLDVNLIIAKDGDAEGSVSGAALSDARVTASAVATGIDGGGDADDIDNRGDIGLSADSNATGVAASLALAGSAAFKGKTTGDVSDKAVSDTSVSSIASVEGIDGGEGDDVINNQGVLNLFRAKVESTGVAASLNIAATGSFKGDSEGNAAGEALSDASVTAMATAVAIDGNTGNDAIDNTRDFGEIVTESGATGVAASLDIAGRVAFKGNVEGEIEGKALSDASTTAYAEAGGIDGGDDNDTIVNEGSFSLLRASSDATGVAASLNVSAGVAIKGDANVDVSGEALSNASVTARSTTTAIGGAKGDDEISNSGNLVKLEAESDATGVAASLDIAGSVAFKGGVEGEIEGKALSDTSVTAEVFAIGIDGGDNDDVIINEGDFEEFLSKSDATGVAASVSTAAGVTFKDNADVNVTGEAVSNATVTADAMVIGIDGGDGNDKIINMGDIVKLQADSTATGVAAGLNFTSVLAIKGNAQADITGEAVGDSSVTVQAMALGLNGELGDDEIDNAGDIRLLSTSDATGVTAELNVSASLNFKGFSLSDVSGTAASNTSVTAHAAAAGISAGDGQDVIRNDGDIILMDQDVGVSEVDANALGVSASLNISGNVAIKGVAAGEVTGTAASNATVTAEATATGIDGGGDNDIIDNTGTIKLLPSSNADGVAAALNISGNMVGETEGSAMSDASVTAKSEAIGIDGGEGADIITNEGTITLMKQEVGEEEVDAEALGVAASLDITGNLNGTAEGEALSKATTTADASATGIDGGSGADEIANTKTITADVDSHAEGVAVAANVSVTGNGVAEGGSLSDVSTTAKAKAEGIDSGEDDDTIDNSGDIQLFSDADATSTAVSVTISGALRGQASGEALSKATTTADATATGISGGDGSDDINNVGLISANTSATTDTVAVAVGITVAETGVAEGAAVSDSSSDSLARSTGIDGGGANDSIDNEGAINVFSLTDAQATAVTVGLTGAMKGLAEGKSVADSSAEAMSQSIGIYGDEGHDELSSSTNQIIIHSQAQSEAQSVAIQLGGAVGVAKNSAVADSSATSLAYSVGLDGGLGNDTIYNDSEIGATAKTDAAASSTSVTATIAVGSAETIGTGDSSATARATATGIQGGGEDDEITNTVAITVGGFDNLGPMANAQAGATTVTVGLAAGLNTGEASSNAAALAEANASGISSGSGDDQIDNSGDITVRPDPSGTGVMANASAKSTAVDVSVTVGASLGESSSDTSSTAVANLAGISGGSGNDRVYNNGTITTGTDPYEAGKTTAMATANAASETVDVDITVGGSFSDASSNASATAQSTSIGIETDTGNDWIDNTGVINAFSSSEAVGLGKTTTASLTLGASDGSAQSNASSLSTALATGIDSGGDVDEIFTDREVVVKARAISTTLSEATNYNILAVGSALQSAEANSSSTAEAIARGIDGGTGVDTITVAGNYEVSADTRVESTSRSSTVTGVSIGLNVQESQSRAGTVSDALAIGIDGGEGDDTINSTATLTVNTFSNAETTATSSSNTGFNIAGSSSGESVSGATSEVIASGIGIRSGISVLDVDESDADKITNEGVISVTTSVTAATNSISNADSITFIGAAEGTAVSDASATVLADGVGIDGGADNDTITSKNTITVKTTADGSVTSTSNVDSYATFGGASSMGVSDASANVLAEATGISGGTGDDTITSRALVEVEAESVGSVNATSNINANVTFGGASSKAVSDASVTKKGSSTGIDGGDGGDVINNYDTLYVRAISAGTVTSNSKAGASAFIGSVSSMTSAAAALEGAVDTKGIIGGSGGDTITNLGRVDSIADATLFVETSSVATAKSDFIGDAEARAFSVSTLQGKASSLGVSGDDGNDLIENEGVVNTSAIANTKIQSVTVAIADSTFGGEFTVAASSNYAAGESNARGITAGAGNDEILNTELVTVEAGGTVTIESEVYSSDGPASSDARTMALAHASGIDSGADDDKVTNAETIFVKAAPRIQSATRTFGRGGLVDGKVGIELTTDAQGITGGEGDDMITNEGDVLVFVGGPETESTVSEDATSGATTFTDNKRIGEDPEAIVGKWIRITGGENPDFFTQVEAFDPATGTFTLHDPIKYDLTVDDGYTLYDYGDKTPDIESVQVTVGGRTQVDASTTASIRATGIEGGDGDDGIMNSGVIEVKASNLIKTVSVTIGRNIDADSNTESTVNAIGIAGDGKDDTSTVTEDSASGTTTFIDTERIGEDPDAIVGKRIRFKTGETADFFTVVEEFDPVTGTFTLGSPIPEGGLSQGDVYALGGGSNAVTNWGTIDVEADATIDASGWVLNFGGSPDIESEGRAQAISAGAQGGEYDDFFKNNRSIETQSTADVTSVQRAIVFFGGGEQELTFEAVSNSVGISTSAGDDIIVNGDGVSAELVAIDVDAIAIAHVNGVTTTFNIFGGGQETNNFVDARSISNAMGLDLGEGKNTADNAGQINVSAESTTTAIAVSDFNLFDETNARANAAATARASGIRAEDGGDMVQSNDAITVGATASADSHAQGSDVIGGTENDFNSEVTEDSPSGSTTFIDESLIPEPGEDPEDIVGQWVRFTSGNNEDFTTQVTAFDPSTGTITLDEALPADVKAEVKDDDGNIITPADEYTIATGREGESGAFAHAFATGIDLDNGLVKGDAMVENKGNLHVRASAKADGKTTTFFEGNADAGAGATADARGIVTGDGDDMVLNTGLLSVIADTQATVIVNGTLSETNASPPPTATGIQTGAGDDQVLNSGAIITEVVLNNADPEAGVGIRTGAGNDTVVLYDPVEVVHPDTGETLVISVKGDVDLGADDDTLYLIGSPVVNGDVLPDGAGLLDSGIDSLVFEGAGFFANPLDGFNRATKQEAGTYIVPRLPHKMQWLEVKEGTLQTNSDYHFSPDGMFQTKVNSDGSHGKFHVFGSSVLDGGLTVLRGPGAYVNGTKYDIIEATGPQNSIHKTMAVQGSITGAFSDVILPAPTPLLRFDVNQLPDLVEVEVHAEKSGTMSTNRTERAVARYLDGIMPTSTGDLSMALGEFQSLSSSGDFRTAFASLSPGQYDNSTRTTYDATEQYTRTLLERMHSLRALLKTNGSAQRSQESSGKEWPLLAYSGSDTSIRQLVLSKQEVQAQRPNAFWLDGFGQWGDQDEDSGVTGYDYNVYGATLGYDRTFAQRYIAGISIGFSDTDIDVDHNQGEGDIDAIYGSLYGSYFTEKMYLDLVLSYGSQDYDNERLVIIGPLQRVAKSDHDGDSYSAFAEGGYNFDLDPWILQPFVSFMYIYLDEDGFTERGAGSLNQIIDDRDTESLVSELGLRVAHTFQLDGVTLIPEVSAAWNYHFDIDDRVITTSYAGSPNVAFSVEGQDLEEHGATVGAGLMLLSTGGLSTSLRYNGEFRQHYDAHGVYGELRYEF